MLKCLEPLNSLSKDMSTDCIDLCEDLMLDVAE